MTTKEDIREWIKRGKAQKATHMIVVCDTFDWEDYPVFVSKDENVHEIETKHRLSSMQKVMEVYNLTMDTEKQINEHRSFNY